MVVLEFKCHGTHTTLSSSNIIVINVKVISCRISAYSGIMGALLKHENVVFNDEQEKESISRVKVG